MLDLEVLKLREFLCAHPGMMVRPGGGRDLIVEGDFEFMALSPAHGEVTDTFNLQVRIPPRYPRDLPVVYELGGRIPRDGNYHVNPGGSLCLGSRLRLLQNVAKSPTLTGFASTCLVPYLFAVSRKLTHGESFVFGELAHGSRGEIMDYMDLLSLKSPDHVLRAIEYLGMKKRRANKLPCPCGCGSRLGRCHFNRKLRGFRHLADRSWFRSINPSEGLF